MTTFEDLVKRCNEFLWVHMYPAPRELVFGSMQHRDLVRTFFAGAFEALMVTEQRQAGAEMFEEYKRMTAVDWQPDSRFMPD